MIGLRHFLLVAGMTVLPGLGAVWSGEGEADIKPDVPIRGEVSVFHSPVRLTAADGVIDSGPAWGHSGPWFEDVDGDGKKDLLVGDFSGHFRFYRNVGSQVEPQFAKGVNLKAGGEDAKVPIY